MSTQLAVRSRVQRERQKIGIVSQIAEAASAASGERDPIIEKAIDRLLVFQQEIAPDSAAGHVKIPLANRDIAAVLDRILSNAANVPSAADAAFTIKIDPRSPLAPVLRSYLNEPPELNFVRTPNRIEIQKNLMTQIQWFEINGTGPSFFNRVTDCPETHRIIAGVALCPDHPVESVSVEEVNATIKKINQLSSVHRYRLPTADEWEVSARAGRKTPFTFGRSIANASDHAWYLQNADLQTHPVGTKRPNDWGLYDMTGHLWQLVDAPLNFQTTFNPAQRSHQLQPAVESVVVRGGSWIDGPELLDVSQSSRLPHDWTCYDVGLRLVRTGR